MKRQRVRAALLLLSALLFPVIIYYFSPALIIMGAIQGIVTGSFIVFSLMLIGSVFFGRLFCAWLCPGGGLQECAGLVRNTTPVLGRRRYIKYGIWLLWLGIILFCFRQSGGIKAVDFFYQTEHGISVVSPEAYVIYYIVVAVIIIPVVLFGRRSFCHYLCWMAPFMVLGGRIRRLLHLPGIYITSEPSRCIACGRCSKTCPMSLDVQAMAQAGSCDDSDCILCGACADICPKKILRYQITRADRRTNDGQ